MENLKIVLQVIVGLGLLNVWLLRSTKKTAYRGKGAESMSAEFAAYGLPLGLMWLVGALKIGVATALLIGIWIPVLVQPAAILLVFLMLGACAMHLKVKDPISTTIPALAMLIMAAAIVWI